MSVGLRERQGERGRVVAGLLMALYLAVVGLIVFWPNADVASASVFWIADHLHRTGAPDWVTPFKVEFATNTLMFMPLTFLGSFLVRRWSWVSWTLVGLAASLSIELTQYAFLSARSAQLADLESNTLGALLGAWVAVPFRPRMGR